MSRSRFASRLLPVLLATLGVSSDALGSPPLPTDEQLDLRAGAWDESVRLESNKQLADARRVLLRAWGLDSPSYEVTVRVAWLSLQLEEASAAVTAYERARTLDGAGVEATQGLASALTLRGWQSLDEGDRAEARSDWQLALQYEPAKADAQRGLELARELRIDPELWGAFLFTTGGSGPDSYGGSGLLHVPIQAKDWLTFRAAFRHVETSGATAPSQPGQRPGSGSREQLRQEEIYAGVGFGIPELWFEAMGIVLVPSDEDVAAGEAARLRVGHRYGVQLEQAVLVREEGTNGQLLPTAFVWPIGWLGLGAGARLTLDPDGQDVSGVLGVSVVYDPVELHLQGHVGAERWPVTMATPQVLSLAQEVDVGGTLTAMFAVSDDWSIGLQTQIERMDSGGQAGVFGAVGAGLRWSPKL